MKKKLCIISIVVVFAFCNACFSKMEINENYRISENKNITNESTIIESIVNSDNTITKDLALKAVDKYCHEMYDWSIAESNPDIMYVKMGEETEDTYQVVFYSYTGSITYFDVNKKDGVTKMTDYVPALNIREETGTINIFDYID